MGREYFSDEFKADAVRRVMIGGFPLPKVRQALDIDETALRRRVEEARARESAPAMPPAAAGLHGSVGALLHARKNTVWRTVDLKALCASGVAGAPRHLPMLVDAGDRGGGPAPRAETFIHLKFVDE